MAARGDRPASTAQAAPFAFVPPGGCASALDRADALRQDPAALERLWRDARVLRLAADGRVRCTDAHALDCARGDVLGPDAFAAALFLGLHEGEPWFAVEDEADAPRVDLRAAAAHWPPVHAAAFAQARAMQHWWQRHRFCGACGGPVRLERAGWLGRCTQCDAEHYPRTDPAVIVAVSDGERLLLGRQAGWPARRWSVLAGFVEPGESLEQTVAREVLEESGVHVHRARYLASQPWPFPGALMLGFVAHAAADAPQASEELEQVRWFTRDEVRAAWARDATGASPADDGPLLSPPISISRWLVGAWLDGARA